jgi:hypothetical protein
MNVPKAEFVQKSSEGSRIDMTCVSICAFPALFSFFPMGEK